MSAFNSYMRQNAYTADHRDLNWAPSKICCYVIVTEQRPIVEQFAPVFRNLSLQAKERT